MSSCPVKTELEKECHAPCAKWFKEYEACGERIKKHDHGNCAVQYFDYLSCVDKCVAPKLWKKLK